MKPTLALCSKPLPNVDNLADTGALETGSGPRRPEHAWMRGGAQHCAHRRHCCCSGEGPPVSTRCWEAQGLTLANSRRIQDELSRPCGSEIRALGSGGKLGGVGSPARASSSSRAPPATRAHTRPSLCVGPASGGQGLRRGRR